MMVFLNHELIKFMITTICDYIDLEDIFEPYVWSIFKNIKD